MRCCVEITLFLKAPHHLSPFIEFLYSCLVLMFSLRFKILSHLMNSAPLTLTVLSNTHCKNMLKISELGFLPSNYSQWFSGLKETLHAKITKRNYTRRNSLTDFKKTMSNPCIKSPRPHPVQVVFKISKLTFPSCNYWSSLTIIRANWKLNLAS